MVEAIGSPLAGSGVGPAGKSMTGLEADLAKYKRALANWCQCASADTPRGKEKIRELTGKAQEIQSRLDTMLQARTSSLSAAPGSSSQTASAAGPQGVGSVIDDLA